jgi:hypothetical protein
MYNDIFDNPLKVIHNKNLKRSRNKGDVDTFWRLKNRFESLNAVQFQLKSLKLEHIASYECKHHHLFLFWKIL